MKKHTLSLIVALIAGISSAQDFADPGYSGAVQAAQWEYFTYANTNAGIGNPPQLSTNSPNADIRQFNPALITSGGNIYSYSSDLACELEAGSSNTLGEVTLQMFLYGQDDSLFNTVRMELDDGTVLVPDLNTNFYKFVEVGEYGTYYTLGYKLVWNLEGRNVSHYSIFFDVLVHTSIDRIRLDTEAVPPRPELAIERAGGDSIIHFESVAGVDYQLQAASSLTNVWTAVGPEIHGDGATVHTTNTLSAPAKFYRVEAWFND